MCVGPVEGAINNELFGKPDPIGESITGWRDPLSESLFGKMQKNTPAASAGAQGVADWYSSPGMAQFRDKLGQTPIGQAFSRDNLAQSPLAQAVRGFGETYFPGNRSVGDTAAAQPQVVSSFAKPPGLMRRMPTAGVGGM